MTETMRERVTATIESSGLTAEDIAGFEQILAQKEKSLKFWEEKNGIESRMYAKQIKGEIAYFTAMIEVLKEMAAVAELEVVAEAVQTVKSLIGKVAKTSLTRKVVAAMANKLKKLGYSLSDAFRKAWQFMKGLSFPAGFKWSWTAVTVTKT